MCDKHCHHERHQPRRNWKEDVIGTAICLAILGLIAWMGG